VLIFKLAFRNIVGAGLRTWLNVFVLSLAFVTIIWMQGFYKGVSEQIMHDMVEAELGGGQFWHRDYDPYDPLTVEDAHGPLSPALSDLAASGRAVPILIAPGAIYPHGRVQTAMLKGIDPEQKIVNLPTGSLRSDASGAIPALIGTRMAKQTGLGIGDFMTVRWRDIHGTFDATDIRIVQIMNTTVSAVDSGQIWLPLDRMREMLQAPNEATLVILAQDSVSIPPGDETWVYRDLDYLLQDFRALFKSKKAGGAILYALLMGLALLAIFDTQVLAVFRRRKEMGTLMALGMPRSKIITLFTLEGALHSLLALVVGAIYGLPLLYLSAVKGFSMPEAMDAMGNIGVAIPTTMYPSYGLSLVAGTALLVFVAVTVVSFLPTRKIVKLKPTDALRGKIS